MDPLVARGCAIHIHPADEIFFLLLHGGRCGVRDVDRVVVVHSLVARVAVTTCNCRAPRPLDGAKPRHHTSRSLLGGIWALLDTHIRYSCLDTQRVIFEPFSLEKWNDLP